MTGRSHHLSEDRLFDRYLSERDGEATDHKATSHLASCSECAARYTDLARFMDALRSESDVEADLLFPPERLRLQQQQIGRRIQLLGHAARVLSFPFRLAASRASATPYRLTPRWVAAVAGLMIGLGVGTLIDLPGRMVQAPSRASVSEEAVTLAAVPALSNPQPPSDDEAFLSDLEIVLGGPRNRELLPFDALTPRVQEISTSLR